jgi:eukaryotic-like serine/threonine-protein kinase
MSVDARLSQLLSRWEELRRQGQDPPAEELCSDCPDLAPELKRRMEALQAVDAVLHVQRRQTPTKRVEPQLQDEIRRLLRSRLLFLALPNLLISFIVLAQLLTDPVHVPYAGTTDILFQLLSTGFCLGTVIVLVRGRSLTLRQLRIMEIVLFGLGSLLMAGAQYRWYHSGSLQSLLKEGKERELVLLAGNSLTAPWVLLIIAYGASIPNTGRRCAAVVCGIASVPLLLTLDLGVHDEVLGGYLLRDVLVGNMLVWLPFASAIAIYGSHKLSALRREVLLARRLGQYRLLKSLGQGGMGEVYLAEHQFLRRPCAIKLIRLDRAGDASSLLRFEREVQAMATLKHWNTVEIYDYGHAEDGTFYYVMEYLPGLDLETLVERHGPLPAGRAVHLLRQACAALNEAHAMGMVHRDIKPGNIIVCERGGVHDVVKLLDFGLVTSVRSSADARLTREGFIVGTPLYMSPEQATGESTVDARSDIYSVGAVAYFLLTGRELFARESILQILVAHQTAPVPPLQTLREDVPDDIQAVVLRCLEKAPAQRFQDATSLAQALQQCQCANQWTQAEAAAWWRDHGTPPAGTRPSQQLTTSIV